MVTILIVDDEKAIRELLQDYLSDNFRIITAGNGIEGLKKFKQNPIDIVFTDVNMPLMDGLTMAREIRKLGFNKLILFVTSSSLSDFEEPFLVIRKPYSLGQLSSLINNAIQKSNL